MSIEQIDYVAAPIKLIGLADTLCFENTTQFIKDLADLMVAQVPTTVTNVFISTGEPNATQRTSVWFKIDTSGTFVGIYVFSEGAWTQIFPVKSKDFTASWSGNAGMTFTPSSSTFKYWDEGDKVSFTYQVLGVIGGSGANTLTFTLPIVGSNLFGSFSSRLYIGTSATPVPTISGINFDGLTGFIVKQDASAFTPGDTLTLEASGFYFKV